MPVISIYNSQNANDIRTLGEIATGSTSILLPGLQPGDVEAGLEIRISVTPIGSSVGGKDYRKSRNEFTLDRLATGAYVARFSTPFAEKVFGQYTVSK